MSKGVFVVFEGPNGCGKGTQINYFQEKLRSTGKAIPVFITGEPNEVFDKVWGARARRLLKRDGDPYQNQLDSLECFSKNRIIHNRVFAPVLNRGSYVVSDRYYYSTFAFQHAQGVSYDDIAMAHNHPEIAIPHVTYSLVVPVCVSLERLAQRDGNKKRKFEGDPVFMQRVLDNYLEQPEILPELMGDRSLVIVDGDRPAEIVAHEIWADFSKRFLQN